MKELLDSRQLKAFVILAGNGSYTETAKQLFVTHSAISHAMRSLEAQIGCRLLSKLNKKAALTEAGEALLPHANRVLEEMRQARNTLNHLNKWGSRRLRLLASAEFADLFLMPVLLQFHQEFPNTLLQVESGGLDEPANWLLGNRSDIALTEKPASVAELEFIPLLADRFHLVVNSVHPLAAAKKSPTRQELGRHPCLLLRGSPDSRKQILDFLTRRDIPLNLAGEFDSVQTIKQFVKQSNAMTLLPGWLVSAELKDQSLTSLSLGRVPLERTWGLLHSRSRPLNHAESTLLKFCRKRIVDLHAPTS